MSLLRDVWTLVHPYWTSEERWGSAFLLLVSIAAEVGLTAVGIGFNTWNAPFFNAIQNRDLAAFIHQLLVWGQWFALLLVAVTANFYFGRILRLRWRRWMTRWFVDEWLNRHAYYRLQLNSDYTDNPDQRITEDINSFVDKSVEFLLGLIHAGLSLIAFTTILWHLSDNFDFFGLVIPGLLCWAALAYAGIGTVLAHLVGRKLSILDFLHQRFEADFRFSLVRIRENAQSIALSDGERQERRSLEGTFERVVANLRRIILNQTNLMAVNRSLGQFTSIFPYILMGPRYFAGGLQLGDLMQAHGAFYQIEIPLRWLMSNYSDLAEWRATVNRLSGFHKAIRDAAAPSEIARRTVPITPGIATDKLDLLLPNGASLAEGLSLHFPKGSRTLVTGPSGCGKSTLFNAIAGIWPHGDGVVTLPAGARLLFLPQRPYLPIGSLRQAVAYPDPAVTYEDDRITEALIKCNLAFLADKLDEEAHWTQRLSPGEQQRLTFARALLIRPDFLFLDEVTSAVEESMETVLYRTLLEDLPETAIISIAHRSTVAPFHHRRVDLAAHVRTVIGFPIPAGSGTH